MSNRLAWDIFRPLRLAISGLCAAAANNLICDLLYGISEPSARY